MFEDSDFWILAGTTAPVIGVSTAITFGTFVRRVQRAEERRPDLPESQFARARRWAGLGEFTVRASGLVLLVVLVLAMVALARHASPVPPWVAILLTGLAALSVLAASGFGNAIDQSIARAGEAQSEQSAQR